MTRYLAYFRQIGSSIEDAGADCPRSGSFGPDPIWIHGSVGCLLWIRGSVGCVFYAFSILRFPPYGSTLYNFVHVVHVLHIGTYLTIL